MFVILGVKKVLLSHCNDGTVKFQLCSWFDFSFFRWIRDNVF